MFGGWLATENVPELVEEPWRDVTVILPELAPAGTPATIVLAVFWEKGALTPLNVTDVVELKPVPEIVTVVATGPWVGVNELIFGVGAAAPARASPNSDSDSAARSANPVRRPRALVEDGTGSDLLERREGVGVLVDPEVHRDALEVGERVRVDHRLHCARRSGPRLHGVAGLPDPVRLGLRRDSAADIGSDRAPLLDHHVPSGRERVLVGGVEHVGERLPEVVARAGAAVVPVHADQVAAGGHPRARAAVRAVVRDALQR